MILAFIHAHWLAAIIFLIVLVALLIRDLYIGASFIVELEE